MEIKNRNIEKQSCTKRETRIKIYKGKKDAGVDKRKKQKKKESVNDWAQEIKKKNKSERGKGYVCPYSMSL
jgi:peroxiredoxin family protein